MLGWFCWIDDWFFWGYGLCGVDFGCWCFGRCDGWFFLWFWLDLWWFCGFFLEYWYLEIDFRCCVYCFFGVVRFFVWFFFDCWRECEEFFDGSCLRLVFGCFILYCVLNLGVFYNCVCCFLDFCCSFFMKVFFYLLFYIFGFVSFVY